MIVPCIQPLCQRLYGTFTSRVDEFRRLMAATGTIAAGGLVLASLRGDGEWPGTELSLFCEERVLGIDGFMQWHEHLTDEGYQIADTAMDTDSVGDLPRINTVFTRRERCEAKDI